MLLSAVAFAGCGVGDVDSRLDRINQRYKALCEQAGAVKLPSGFTPERAERYRRTHCPKKREKGSTAP